MVYSLKHSFVFTAIYFNKLNEFCKKYKRLFPNSKIYDILTTNYNQNTPQVDVVQFENLKSTLEMLWQLIDSCNKCGTSWMTVISQNFWMSLSVVVVSCISRLFVIFVNLSLLTLDIYENRLESFQKLQKKQKIESKSPTNNLEMNIDHLQFTLRKFQNSIKSIIPNTTPLEMPSDVIEDSNQSIHNQINISTLLQSSEPTPPPSATSNRQQQSTKSKILNSSNAANQTQSQSSKFQKQNTTKSELSSLSKVKSVNQKKSDSSASFPQRDSISTKSQSNNVNNNESKLSLVLKSITSNSTNDEDDEDDEPVFQTAKTVTQNIAKKQNTSTTNVNQHMDDIFSTLMGSTTSFYNSNKPTSPNLNKIVNKRSSSGSTPINNKKQKK